jgi:SAM-dependent methyltransferase
MYERLELCPSCHHTKFHNHLIVSDHFLSGESFALMQCDQCKLIFTNPRPIESESVKYYMSDEYISHSNKSNSPVNFLYKLARIYTIQVKLNLIRKYHPNGSLLDFGCGTGFFLTKSQRFFDVQGIEPSINARNIAPGNLTIHSSLSDLRKKHKFNVITLWHVLEHIYDLRDTIKALKKHLHKAGTLIIAVPNHLSYDAATYKEFWAAYDVPRHLYHFDQQSMEVLLRKNKLQIVETVPMKLDSFYVSMLSERYKQSPNPLFNGLKNGFRSNQKARITGEYSSLIFVCKK